MGRKPVNPQEEKEPQGLDISLGERGHLYGLIKLSLRDKEGDVLSLVDAIFNSQDFSENDKALIADWLKRVYLNLLESLWSKLMNDLKKVIEKEVQDEPK